jgi:cytochrome c5
VSEQDDKVFIRHFSGILIALVVFTISMAFLGRSINQQLTPSENPSRIALTKERIAPIAGVYVGDSGAQAVADMAAQADTTAPAAPAAAFDGSLDGGMLYNNVCMACHATGAAGAPIPGSDQWAERAASGLDELLSNAINGLNTMPARGGRADLSDEQVKVIIEFMLTQ